MNKLLTMGFACAVCALAPACGDSTGTGGAGGSGSSTTSSESSTSAGGGGASPGGGPLAAACASDVDCGDDLRCLLPSEDVGYFHGGPASGYCSKSCVVQADCPDGACRGEGADGICLRSCVAGEPPLLALNDPIPADKCLGREDLRCQPVGTGQDLVEVCVPTCGVDAQCPDGWLCDPLNTVCTMRPSEGLPLGDHCDPDLAVSPCAGICVGLTLPGDPQPGFCSSLCVFGGTDLELDCGGLDSGLCAFSPPNGLGDFGLCTEACAEQDDCDFPFTACRTVAGLTGGRTEKGYCFSPDDCPNGAANCDGFDCVDTDIGPKCIDPAFPLGDGGAGGGGAGG